MSGKAIFLGFLGFALMNYAVAYIWILGGYSPEAGWLVYVSWDVRPPRPDSMHRAAHLHRHRNYFARVQLAVNGTCLATFDQPDLDFALETVNVSALGYDMQITCFAYKRKYEGRCKIKGKVGPPESTNFNWSAQIFWGPPPYKQELTYLNGRQLQHYPDDFNVPLCKVELKDANGTKRRKYTIQRGLADYKNVKKSTIH